MSVLLKPREWWLKPCECKVWTALGVAVSKEATVPNAVSSYRQGKIQSTEIWSKPRSRHRSKLTGGDGEVEAECRR